MVGQHVHEEDSFPFPGKIEHLIQIPFGLRGIEANLSNTDHEQRLARSFGNSFCCELENGK
jgi:hypothetical protein